LESMRARIGIRVLEERVITARHTTDTTAPGNHE
jgi:hypothetical protein